MPEILPNVLGVIENSYFVMKLELNISYFACKLLKQLFSPENFELMSFLKFSRLRTSSFPINFLFVQLLMIKYVSVLRVKTDDHSNPHCHKQKLTLVAETLVTTRGHYSFQE